MSYRFTKTHLCIYSALHQRTEGWICSACWIFKFSSQMLVAVPRLMNPVSPTNHPLLVGENYHHRHVVSQARISLTLSRHFSLSFIASGRSSGIRPVSSHSCWMYVRAGRPAFARPYVGVQWSTSLMNSSLILQQWPACLVRLTWIVFVMGGRWPNRWCLVGCCLQDLFKIALRVLV